jgi:hypothetical protein
MTSNLRSLAAPARVRCGDLASQQGGKAPGIKVEDDATLMPRFTKDLAETSGRSERAIRDDIKILDDLEPEADAALKGSKASTAKIRKISKMPPTPQRKAAKTVKAGKVERVVTPRTDHRPTKFVVAVGQATTSG